MQDQETLSRYFSWDPREDPEFAPMLVGTGSIGGKGRSLLFAIRKLRSSGDESLAGVRLAPSRFLGVGVFREVASQIPDLEDLRRRHEPEAIEAAFLRVPLPEYVTAALQDYLATMTDPVVVRSSSVLEDSLKHSFAGKYLSTFLLNQGSLDDRVRAVSDQIRRIYARIYYPTALSYRGKHGLGDDEMGIIVMRMAGRWRGRYYYPTTGGVGYSRNMRRWTTRVRMEDGILRFVFGLGTMSTKRGYARNFSLTNPMLRPEGPNPYKVMKHAQERFQVIDGQTGELVTLDIKKLWREFLAWHPNLGIFAQLYQTDGDEGYFSTVDYSTVVPEHFAKICFTFEDFPRRWQTLLHPHEGPASPAGAEHGGSCRHRVRLRACGGRAGAAPIPSPVDRGSRRRRSPDPRTDEPPGGAPGGPDGHRRYPGGNPLPGLRGPPDLLHGAGFPLRGPGHRSGEPDHGGRPIRAGGPGAGGFQQPGAGGSRCSTTN